MGLRLHGTGFSFVFFDPIKLKWALRQSVDLWPRAVSSQLESLTELLDFSISVWLGSVDSKYGAVCAQEVVNGDFRLVIFIICSIGCWNPSCTTSRPVIQTSLHLSVHICREGVPTSQTFLEELIHCERKKICLAWLPRWLKGKESACQYRRCGSDPWVRKIPWRRRWQPTPVFLPGESHGQRSLVDYSPWGHRESDMTDWVTKQQHVVNALDILTL